VDTRNLGGIVTDGPATEIAKNFTLFTLTVEV
jgi:hypothetical protein